MKLELHGLLQQYLSDFQMGDSDCFTMPFTLVLMLVLTDRR